MNAKRIGSWPVPSLFAPFSRRPFSRLRSLSYSALPSPIIAISHLLLSFPNPTFYPIIFCCPQRLMYAVFITTRLCSLDQQNSSPGPAAAALRPARPFHPKRQIIFINPFTFFYISLCYSFGTNRCIALIYNIVSIK